MKGFIQIKVGKVKAVLINHLIGRYGQMNTNLHSA